MAALVSSFMFCAVELTQAALVTLGPGGGGSQLCAAIHPQNADIMLLGQDVGGILKTTDGGQSWLHVNRGLAVPGLTADAFGVQELQFSKMDPSLVFAATWGGLFRSADTAETWTRVLPPGGEDVPERPAVSAVAVSPDGSLVLAGTGDPFAQTEGAGLFRSVDGGNLFAPVAASGIPAGAIFGRIVFDSDFAGPNFHVYSATSAGLYRSANGGVTFEKVRGGFTHDNVRDLAFAQSGGSKTLWLALETTEQGEGGVYRSTDGLQWTAATGDLPVVRDGVGRRPYALLVHPQELTKAYISLRLGFELSALYGTSDGGAHWNQLTPDEIVLGWNRTWSVWPYGAALSPAKPARILLANDAQPMLSDDGGQTWRQVGTSEQADGSWSGRGVEVTFAYAVKEAPGHPKHVYAAYEDIGLWKSANGGASWTPVYLTLPDAQSTDGCSELHVNPAEGNEFYAVGASWSNGLREPDSPSHLLYSSDGGGSLSNLTAALLSAVGRGCAAVDFSGAKASRTLLFARHGQSVYRSINGGATWATADIGMSPAHRELMFVMGFDPERTAKAYAGTHTGFGAHGASGGLYRSSDAGATWQLASNYPYQDVHFIGKRGAPRRLFVGGGTHDKAAAHFVGALAVSDDDGATFRSVLSQPYVMDVVEMPGSPGTLLAAAGGHYLIGKNQHAGIYRSTDNGETWERLNLVVKHTGLLTLLAPSWDTQSLIVGTRGDGLFAETLPAPAGSRVALAIQLVRDAVELSWPESTSDLVLQSVERLDIGSMWTNVLTTVERRGSANVAVVPRTEPSRFFRLAAP